MGSMLGAVITALEGHLDRETGAGPHRSMHWRHRQQLTLPEAAH
jgi:hypothetical protein